MRGETRGLVPGRRCENLCKSRAVVMARCAGMGDFHAISRTTGVLGCIVAEFNEGVYALVFKARNREFKACNDCFSLCDARVSHTVVEATCAMCMSTTHRRDVALHRIGPPLRDKRCQTSRMPASS